MMKNMLSRRALLRSSMALGGLPAEVLDALQHAHQSVQNPPARFEYLDSAIARDIEALSATIIPSDETPGAREAGVIYFIDRALATFDQANRELYRKGIAAAQQKQSELFPEARSIAALTDKQRIELVRTIEQTEFFEVLRTHVITGFLADPQWGGNRGGAGWKVIGLDPAGSFQPPFGYYDPGAKE